MSAITAEMVRDLREKTGAGMMDCKKALSQTQGDMEQAIAFLREKGLAAAQKKAGRIAAEGKIGIFVGNGVAAMVEVNCETDFVARNDDFGALVEQLAKQAAQFHGAHSAHTILFDGASLMPEKFVGDTSKTVETVLNDKVATIGEKIAIRRFAQIKSQGAFGSYSHGGSMGVVVELNVGEQSKKSDPRVDALARDIAMHIAAAAPLYMKRDEVAVETLNAEREIYRNQALEQGKPEAVVGRIVDGKVEKYFADTCLPEQAFVKDPSLTIAKLVTQVSKEVGSPLHIERFARFKVGEGIEKKADDFLSEVAKMAQ